MKVDGDFDQIKKQGVTTPHNVIDPLNLDYEKDTMKVIEDSISQQSITDKTVSSEIYKENAFRYFHEKNKILFIF